MISYETDWLLLGLDIAYVWIYSVTMRLSVRVFLHGLCDEMVKSSLRLLSPRLWFLGFLSNLVCFFFSHIGDKCSRFALIVLLLILEFLLR